MLTLRRGRVTAVVSRAEGLVRIEVDGAPCVAYPRLTGPVALGDEVIVNIQARELELGSGGFDVLYANMTRGLELAAEGGAHVMKLPYTPGQAAAVHAEEGRALPETLDGLPVVCCSLHSQLAPVCAGIGDGLRLAYVQLPGGALPVSLSDTMRTLRERGLVATSVGVDACLDGDVQCVSVASALLWCAAEGFDAVVCGIGPGIVGTGSEPRSPRARAGWCALRPRPPNRALCWGSGCPPKGGAAAPRRRGSDGTMSAHRAVAAWPRGVEAPEWLRPREEIDSSGWRDACAELPLSHMGRGIDEDALFFAAAFAAGRLARARCGSR